MWDMLGAFKQSVANGLCWSKGLLMLITLVLLDLYCICYNFLKTVQLRKAELNLKTSWTQVI